MDESIRHHPNNLFDPFERQRRARGDVFDVSGLSSSIRSVAPGTVPAINVGRTPSSVGIHAFAPGLDASQFEVTLDRGVLRISGERASCIPGSDDNVQVCTGERATGSLTWAVSLPDDIDPGQVNASYSDGMLQVSVAQRASVQPNRITVQCIPQRNGRTYPECRR